MELEHDQSITDRLFSATMDNLQDAWLITGPTLWGDHGDVILSLYRHEQTFETMLRGTMDDYLAETT